MQNRFDRTEGARGIVFWNTWYRASAGSQLEHILEMEDQLSSQGAKKVLFCLSETTEGNDEGLVETLARQDFHTSYCPTSQLKNGKTEGLCFAQRDSVAHHPQFELLSYRRAIANKKARWLGATAIDELSVLSVHASYPSPTRQETDGIINRITSLQQDDKQDIVLGGDFNTLLRRKQFINKIQTTGMAKIILRKPTVTFGVRTLGVELDHVFVSSHLINRTGVEIHDKGPSNHHPIVVTVHQ